MFRNFQFIPKHSNLFSGHFKSVPENIQIVPKHSDLFSEHFKKCSGTLRRFFKCLPKYSDLFSILFPNIRIFWRTFIFVLWTFKKCSGKLSNYSEIFLLNNKICWLRFISLLICSAEPFPSKPPNPDGSIPREIKLALLRSSRVDNYKVQ